MLLFCAEEYTALLLRRSRQDRTESDNARGVGRKQIARDSRPVPSRGGAVLLKLKRDILADRTRIPFTRTLAFYTFGWLLLWCGAPGLAQKASQNVTIVPKYDVHTEMKTKGTVDEVNLLALASKQDIAELIIKSGDDKIHIYVCPKAFEDEMGISFTKGDEIAVTGSKVKQEAVDVILARELVKGTDTLVFRDDKGNPVWNARTGK